MKHRYTAKISFEDGESLFNNGDDVEELISWMKSQAEASFGQTNGEVIDNHTQKVIKSFQYTPPEE